jgi:membrane protein DedA with SNARE-associated domain
MQAPKKPEKQGQFNHFLKYSGLGIQMALTIYVGHWLGQYVDSQTQQPNPFWTQIITLIAVFLAIVSVIRQVIRDQDKA